jgi:hypothetical protein
LKYEPLAYAVDPHTPGSNLNVPTSGPEVPEALDAARAAEVVDDGPRDGPAAVGDELPHEASVTASAVPRMSRRGRMDIR